MIWNDYKAQIQHIEIKQLTSQNIQLSILREDLIHPEISGNKFRKLKYNFLEAQKLGFKKLLTFGGAFSNHIAQLYVSLNNAEWNFILFREKLIVIKMISIF